MEESDASTSHQSAARTHLILVVDEDEAKRSAICDALCDDATRVEGVDGGRVAMEMASRLEPDVVVLDLGLSDVSGVEFCHWLRRWSRNPVLALADDVSVAETVAVLDAGADDVVSKSISIDELRARMRVALRHRELVQLIDDGRPIDIGDLHVDVSGRSADIDGKPMTLTAKEFDLLVVLSRTPGRVVRTQQILQLVWGEEGAWRPGSVRVHATALRKKLGDGPRRPRIVNVRGVGYALGEPVGG